jgi:aspartyl-tRNA(Asn)/glutamyl-tRNA(Gln) amidotransferase subunit A
MSVGTPDFRRIAALDAKFAFLEEPEASLPLDVASAGSGNGKTSGPLVGIKANIRVKGQAFTAGIDSRRAQISSEDAWIVARLRHAGACFLSRLNMDEAALGASCNNPAFRRTDNPAAPGYSAGGSSGGSAAAVASGACRVALGTDTLGSVRIPAAYCGVFGLKPGLGVLPMDGVFPLAPGLDTLGLIGRSTNEMGKLLEICGVFPNSSCRRVAIPQTGKLKDLTPEVAAAFEGARRKLGDTGIEAVPIDTDFDFARIRADAFVLTEIEAAETLGAEKGLSGGLRKLLDYGRGISLTERHGIDARLNAVADRAREIVNRDCYILLPTVAEPAFAHGERAPAGQADFTALANVAGLPALAVPMPASGRPVSIQLIGPEGSEHALLALAGELAANA